MAIRYVVVTHKTPATFRVEVVAFDLESPGDRWWAIPKVYASLEAANKRADAELERVCGRNPTLTEET